MIAREKRSLHVQAIRLAAFVSLAAGLGACQKDDNQQADESTIEAGANNSEMLTSAIAKIGDLSTSSKLIGVAQLGPAIDGKGSYTLFLPVDEAWTSLATTERAAIESAENRPQLIAVLRQHISPGFVLATDLEKGLSRKNGEVTLTTMGATPITLHKDGETIMLGKSKEAPRIVGAPIVAGNDVIYRIDRLIPPPD